MKLANFRSAEDGETTENGPREAIEAPLPDPLNQSAAVPIPVLKGARLNVDEILMRSLPRLSQPAVLGRVNKVTPG